MKQKGNVGIILNHISLRSDIRLLINELSVTYHVVLFGERNDYYLLDCGQCDFRQTKILSNNFLANLRNRILRFLYFFFGNLPKTRKEYDDYQVRMIHKLETIQIKKALKKHRIKMILPHFFSFDLYLKLLKPSKCRVSDIDYFIAFTDLNTDSLLSKIIKEKKRLLVYVHSWDHIPKFTRFLKKNVEYITWNKLIKDDLVNIHGIDENKIYTVGTSQFYFIKDYFESRNIKKTSKLSKYIYFPCSFGYPIVANQEVKIIIFLSEILMKVDRDIKIVVRAYPMLKNWKIYGQLSGLENILFDDFEITGDVILDKDKHLYKTAMIDNALAVFHTGTTIGLEASYFDTPVIYLNINDLEYGILKPNQNHIQHSWNQYHLKKYYLLPKYISVVQEKGRVKDIIYMLLNNDKTELLKYNQLLRTYSPLMSISEFTAQFIDLIQGSKQKN